MSKLGSKSPILPDTIRKDILEQLSYKNYKDLFRLLLVDKKNFVIIASIILNKEDEEAPFYQIKLFSLLSQMNNKSRDALLQTVFSKTSLIEKIIAFANQSEGEVALHALGVCALFLKRKIALDDLKSLLKKKKMRSSSKKNMLKIFSPFSEKAKQSKNKKKLTSNRHSDITDETIPDHHITQIQKNEEDKRSYMLKYSRTFGSSDTLFLGKMEQEEKDEDNLKKILDSIDDIKGLDSDTQEKLKALKKVLYSSDDTLLSKEDANDTICLIKDLFNHEPPEIKEFALNILIGFIRKTRLIFFYEQDRILALTEKALGYASDSSEKIHIAAVKTLKTLVSDADAENINSELEQRKLPLLEAAVIVSNENKVLDLIEKFLSNSSDKIHILVLETLGDFISKKTFRVFENAPEVVDNKLHKILSLIKKFFSPSKYVSHLGTLLYKTTLWVFDNTSKAVSSKADKILNLIEENLENSLPVIQDAALNSLNFFMNKVSSEVFANNMDKILKLIEEKLENSLPFIQKAALNSLSFFMGKASATVFANAADKILGMIEGILKKSESKDSPEMTDIPMKVKKLALDSLNLFMNKTPFEIFERNADEIFNLIEDFFKKAKESALPQNSERSLLTEETVLDSLNIFMNKASFEVFERKANKIFNLFEDFFKKVNKSFTLQQRSDNLILTEEVLCSLNLFIGNAPSTALVKKETNIFDFIEQCLRHTDSKIWIAAYFNLVTFIKKVEPEVLRKKRDKIFNIIETTFALNEKSKKDLALALLTVFIEKIPVNQFKLGERFNLINEDLKNEETEIIEKISVNQFELDEIFNFIKEDLKNEETEIIEKISVNQFELDEIFNLLKENLKNEGIEIIEQVAVNHFKSGEIFNLIKEGLKEEQTKISALKALAAAIHKKMSVPLDLQEEGLICAWQLIDIVMYYEDPTKPPEKSREVVMNAFTALIRARKALAQGENKTLGQKIINSVSEFILSESSDDKIKVKIEIQEMIRFLQPLFSIRAEEIEQKVKEISAKSETTEINKESQPQLEIAPNTEKNLYTEINQKLQPKLEIEPISKSNISTEINEESQLKQAIESLMKENARHNKEKLMQSLIAQITQAKTFSTVANLFDFCLSDFEVTLNAHKNPLLDRFFGIKNTKHWANTIKTIRDYALSVLFKEVHQIKDPQEKIKRLKEAQDKAIINYHRGNFTITGAFGNTGAAHQIEKMIAELKRSEQKNKPRESLSQIGHGKYQWHKN